MMYRFRAAALFVVAGGSVISASVAPPTAEEVYAADPRRADREVEGWIASGWQVNSADARGITRLSSTRRL
jgi:hypothetical protein